MPYAILTGPPGSSAMSAAVAWTVETASGSVFTAAATLGIAGIGFAALQGRLQIRRAAIVCLGCFLVLGSNIGWAWLRASVMDQQELAVLEPSPVLSVAEDRAPQTDSYDAQAGASVRHR